MKGMSRILGVVGIVLVVVAAAMFLRPQETKSVTPIADTQKSAPPVSSSQNKEKARED